MKKDLFDVDDQREDGSYPRNLLVLEKRRLTNDRRLAIDPERIGSAGNQGDEPCVGIGEDVLKPVKATASRSVRNSDRAFIEHHDEAWLIASWSDITRTVGTGGGNKTKRRGREPSPMQLAQTGAHLVGGTRCWRSDERFEFTRRVNCYDVF
jgi:hypothetical protein